MGLLARLGRMVPMIIVLAILAIVIYFVVQWKSSPSRAKEILIKVFTWITIAISIFFGIVTLYAGAEGNMAVLDLSVSCLIVTLVALGITRWCNHVFLKHNPHYKAKRNVKAKTKRRFPWSR